MTLHSQPALRSLWAALGLTISVSLSAAVEAPRLSTDPTDVPQITAEPPLRTPATKTCTETVLVHTFANSYYAPGYGSHAASACPGPWSFVALGVEVSTSGVQFDRMFDIYVGHVPLLSSSTSEPASEVPGAITHWHVDADVSRFAGMLASDQPITAILNNVNDATYTGQYAVTLTLTYYATGPASPAIVAPDYVGAVFNPGDAPHQDGPGDLGTSGYAGLGAKNTNFSKSLTLPQNLLGLVADVYAQGHGACEEFWWAEPSQCGVGTPLRQVVLSIDGVIAGIAPVYPTIFTGGGGPGSWSPIPSPRAWHVDPYRLDLGPFVGRLVDGKPHSFKIDVPDAAYSDPGDYWVVGAALLGITDPQLSQTTGALTSAPVADTATESLTQDPTGLAVLDFTGSRSASWSGYVVGSAGRVDTTVSNQYDIRSTSADAVDSTWHWTTASKVTAGTAAPVTTTVAHTYTLASTLVAGGRFGDAVTTTVDGPSPYTASSDLELTTVGAVYANVTEAETYAGSDSTGYCFQRIVNASGGYVVSDQTLPVCLSSGTTTGSTSGGSTTGGSTTGGSGTTTGGSTTGGTTAGDTTGGTSGSSTGGSTGVSTTGSSTTGSTGGGTTTGSQSPPVSTASSASAAAQDSRLGGGAWSVFTLLPLMLLSALKRRRTK